MYIFSFPIRLLHSAGDAARSHATGKTTAAARRRGREEGMFILATAVAEKLPENCFGCLSIHVRMCV